MCTSHYGISGKTFSPGRYSTWLLWGSVTWFSSAQRRIESKSFTLVHCVEIHERTSKVRVEETVPRWGLELGLLCIERVNSHTYSITYLYQKRVYQIWTIQRNLCGRFLQLAGARCWQFHTCPCNWDAWTFALDVISWQLWLRQLEFIQWLERLCDGAEWSFH